MAEQVRVNPASVRQYGQAANQHFDNIRGALQRLVDAVAHVDYVGENANRFKQECGALTVAFAQGMGKDITSMANSVNAATTAIGRSLGGQAVTITIDQKPVTPTAGKKDDDGVVQVNTDALSDLQNDVNAQFDIIREELGQHASKLNGTDWTGQAKHRAVSEVNALTTHATGQCQEASKQINDYIRAQVDSVLTVDV